MSDAIPCVWLPNAPTILWRSSPTRGSPCAKVLLWLIVCIVRGIKFHFSDKTNFSSISLIGLADAHAIGSPTGANHRLGAQIIHLQHLGYSCSIFRRALRGENDQAMYFDIHAHIDIKRCEYKSIARYHSPDEAHASKQAPFSNPRLETPISKPGWLLSTIFECRFVQCTARRLGTGEAVLRKGAPRREDREDLPQQDSSWPNSTVQLSVIFAIPTLIVLFHGPTAVQESG